MAGGKRIREGTGRCAKIKDEGCFGLRLLCSRYAGLLQGLKQTTQIDDTMPQIKVYLPLVRQ